MSIKIGNTEIKKVYVGNTEIVKLYIGNDLVYSSAPPAPSFCAEALAYFNRMDVDPPTGLKTILNTAIADMISAEIWNELDQFVFQCLHSDQANKLDIKGNFDHTWYDTISSVEKVGTTITTSAPAHIATGYLPINGTKFTLNNCGIYFSNNITENGGDGTYNNGATMPMFGIYAGYNCLNEMNWSGNIIWSNTGNNMFVREDDTFEIARNDGTESTWWSPSSTISDTEFELGRIHTIDTASMFAHSGLYRYYGFGSGMNATKRAAFDAILTAFLTELPTAY